MNYLKHVIPNVFEVVYKIKLGFPGGTGGKEPTCQCRGHGFDPWVKKIPGEGNGYPLQYSCLENPRDRKAWQAIVHRVTKESDTT